jgi:hypothetical protein
MGVIGRTRRGIADAVRARPRLFLAIAVAVFALDILVPPALLSLARKPVAYFALNAWLPSLPSYLVSGRGSVAERLDRAWGLALFWFSASNEYGSEWGFAVTVADLVRFLVMAFLVATYFVLVLARRDQSGIGLWGRRAGGPGGALGAFGSILGISTGGCTVMGCGAPVIPVVGLAFVGLSSTTLKLMSELSTIATTLVIGGLAVAVLWLGWREGARHTPGRTGA